MSTTSRTSGFALAAGAALAALTGCDRNPLDMGLIPEPDPDYPSVVDLGELEPIYYDMNTYSQEGGEIVYADVGPPESGDEAGVTFTFVGTGNPVCVIMDPEAVYWNQAVSPNPDSVGASHAWSDDYSDDGDLDMYAGFAANYTGTPGVEIGDFKGQYTDSLGNVTQIEYDLCEATGYNDQSPAHAGRATYEACSIETDGREGVEYTVLLKVFSLPQDDGVLSFATTVVELSESTGDCSDLGVTECTLAGESPQDGFEDLEEAYCNDELAEFCEANPDLCGDPD